MNSGIYKITCNATNKMYIGSSINIQIRVGKHKKQLCKNTHHNKYLQNAWNKYGEENFKFETIETVVKETEELSNLLEARENYWISYYNSSNNEIGFNLYQYARKPLGYKYSKEIIQKRIERNKKYGTFWMGKKHTEETKRKISIGNKNKTLTDQTKNKLRLSKIGTKSAIETKEKISNATKGINNPRAILNEEQVIQIRKMYKEKNMTIIEICKLFNVGWSAISNIVKYKSWRHLNG